MACLRVVRRDRGQLDRGGGDQLLVIAHGLKRRAEQRAKPGAELHLVRPQALDLAAHLLAFRVRLVDDLAGTGLGLADDQLGVVGRLCAHLVGGALRRHQRVAHRLLGVAQLAQRGLQLVHAVLEVGPVAPDVLECRGRVDHDLVDLRDAIAEEAPLGALVPEFYW